MSSRDAEARGGRVGVALAGVALVGALLGSLLGALAAEWLGQPDSRAEPARACAWLLALAAAALALAPATLAIGALRRRWGRPPSRLLAASPATALAIAAVLAVAAGSTAQLDLVARDDLARLIPRTSGSAVPADGPLVRLRGVVLDRPSLSERSGSMAAFDPWPRRWRFRLAAHRLVGPEGSIQPCQGRVIVAASGNEPPAHAGETVEVFGRLVGFAPRRNPGGFDSRAWARRAGLSAALWLEDPAALRRIQALDEDTLVPERSTSWSERLRPLIVRWRASLRLLAEQSLLHRLPASASPETRALLLAMFLGQREPDLAELEEAFRRTGSMHLVAISGFNLAVLATAAMAVATVGRSRGGDLRRPRRPRLGPCLVIALISLYLCTVEAQPAVLRAGAMILVAQLGHALGRHWSTHGVYCLAALVLLLVRPGDVGNAGFQLSFAVVAALVWLAPVLERRLFGRLDRDGASLAHVLRRRAASAVAAALAAWLVATPLSLHHFGIVSPLAAPLSLVAVPLASSLLVVGYAKMLLTPFVPLAGTLLGWPLARLAELLASLVRAADALPGSAIHLPAPGPAWTIAMLLAVAAAIAAPRLLLRRAARLAVLLGALWSARGFLPLGNAALLRIDMLAVGDGTCILLRSGNHATLFDAGSTDVSVGDRVVVPALRALGVRRLDVIVVSHANLDHFDAVIEVVDAFDVHEILLTPQFLRCAQADPAGAPALLLSMLAARGMQPTLAEAGTVRHWGAASGRWLHPAATDRPRRVNDTSQVILLEVAQETHPPPTLTAPAARVLLCGDIEEEAIAALERREPSLRADIVELPHHGSWREATAHLLDRLQAAIVLQSTGRRRLIGDRWPGVLGSASRLVTARDGASWVEIGRDGRLSAGGFVSGTEPALRRADPAVLLPTPP